MTKKIKIADLVADPAIQIRDICKQTISEYKGAMSAGAKFPPLVIEAKTNRIVCGNQRYHAYRGFNDPAMLIDCEVETYKTETDLLIRAAEDNSRHGRPLSTWDRKRIIMRLEAAGVDTERISEILCLPVKRVISLAGFKVIVTGGGGKTPKYKRPMPVKRGLEHMVGETITAKQYDEHATKDRGVSLIRMAQDVARWIENGWVNEENEAEVQALEYLRDALNNYFAPVAKAK